MITSPKIKSIKAYIQKIIVTLLPLLPLTRYRLTFQAATELRLPTYTGSAWRGAFGHALKRLVCVTREPTCPTCLLYRSCLYPYIFETPPDPNVGKLTKYTAAPHPYVLIPQDHGGTLPSGTSVALDVHLFGHAQRHLPHIIHALQQAGQRGLGRQHGTLELLSVALADHEDWRTIYVPGHAFSPLPTPLLEQPPVPERLTLHFLTPLRLNSDGQLVSQDQFRFHHLFSNLLRRISLLTAFHTDHPLAADFAGLTQAAHTLDWTRASLRWHDWARFSSRQETRVQMGGLIGEVELAGTDLEPFWPYLWLGQWTHAGKGAVMGLGRYQIHSL